uniref:Zinc transporter ZIP1 n=1 Tax=Angiostrongylus cantonensis TaxID=6313 RepID=A0A0K0CWJ9_ANGCA
LCATLTTPLKFDATAFLLHLMHKFDRMIEQCITVKCRFSLVMEETANYAVAEASEGSLLKSLTFAIAMSFHSILEGFALGVQNTTARIVTLFISLILHKGVEAFSVGLQISKGNSHKVTVVTTIIIYALMTPLGSGLGTLLQLSNISRLHKDGAVLTLESLAAGTFIYVTFLEVLAQEKDNEHNSLKQLLAIFIGFAIIAALQIAFGINSSEHDHEGGHMQRFPNDSSADVITVIPH